MISLAAVQNEVASQIHQDFFDKTWEQITEMMYAGLSEEVGEIQGLHKREIRRLKRDLPKLTEEEFKSELGDVLWYLAGLCIAKGFTLEEIWEYNVKKLEERHHEDYGN